MQNACLPFFFNTLQDFSIYGLYFLATIAGKKRALRRRPAPIFDNLGFPLTDDPENFCEGDKPA